MGTRSAVAELSEQTRIPPRVYPRGVLIGLYSRTVHELHRKAGRDRFGNRQDPDVDALQDARNAVVSGLMKRWSWYRVGIHLPAIHALLRREASRIASELFHTE